MNISNSTPVPSTADQYSGATAAEVAQRQAIVHALRALSQANMFGENREITFTLDRASRRMVIHVIDRDTRETVMQLPPEYILQLAANTQRGA